MNPTSPLGFLAVEVFIHRPPGDPYNSLTWPFPLIHEIVPDSSESQIVSQDHYDDEFIERCVAAGKRLAMRGAVGIITSCGFLVLAQKKLAARLPIPIATSALLQIPSVETLLPPTSVIGVLTYDGNKLGKHHFEQLDVDVSLIRIRGLPANGRLRAVIQEGARYDAASMEDEIVSEAVALCKEYDNIRAIILECTQMPPYADAVQKALGIPVYDVYTLGLWFYSGLSRESPRFLTMQR